MVGFVLVIAAVITYLAYVSDKEVPRWGEKAEVEWDRDVGEALLRLGRSASEVSAEGGPVSGLVPSAPEPQSLDLPLVGRAEPARPAGALSYAPACGGVVARHGIGAIDVADIASGGRGCLVFQAQPTYTAGFGYRVELGGVLRVQSDRASVLAGPPLQLTKEPSGDYSVSLSAVGLRGTGASLGAERSGVVVDLVPIASSVELAAAPNAGDVDWTFTTPYPEAWETWFNDRIAQAGFDPSHNHACTSLDVSDPACAALADDRVLVVFRGPDATTSRLDVTLSVSYAEYEVTLR